MSDPKTAETPLTEEERFKLVVQELIRTRRELQAEHYDNPTRELRVRIDRINATLNTVFPLSPEEREIRSRLMGAENG